VIKSVDTGAKDLDNALAEAAELISLALATATSVFIAEGMFELDPEGPEGPMGLKGFAPASMVLSIVVSS
jgi:hypothetical protein